MTDKPTERGNPASDPVTWLASGRNKERNCWNCKHRQEVPGNAHISCGNLNAAVKGDPHGIRCGWFVWPFCFDPVWLMSCDGWEANAKLSDENRRVDPERLLYGKSCDICHWTNSGLLNVGEHEKPKWVCHGCITRELTDRRPEVRSSDWLGIEAMKHENPKVKVGDKIQVGTELTTGEIMWGSIQTVQSLDSQGTPIYRPKWAKVDKMADYWRMPNAKLSDLRPKPHVAERTDGQATRN